MLEAIFVLSKGELIDGQEKAHLISVTNKKSRKIGLIFSSVQVQQKPRARQWSHLKLRQLETILSHSYDYRLIMGNAQSR